MTSNPAPVPVRVFLADDSAPIRQRVGALLAGPAVDIVGEAETPEACIRGILAVHPDVVVLDIQLDGGTGLQVLKAVRGAAPDIAFVVFSNNTAAVYRKRYLQEGAVSFLDKSTDIDRLADAVAHASRPVAH